MEIKTNRIVLMKSDYDIMSSYLKGTYGKGNVDGENAYKLLSELKRATIVRKDVFPKKVVRINSRVLVKEETGGKLFEITLVTPEKADIKSNMISFMAPISVALIGFKEGDRVKWQVPSGEKVFVIMKVTN